MKKKVNPTRDPIEQKESFRWLENIRQSVSLLVDPGRCVHVGGRESDIYELYCVAHDLGTHFLVRTCVDRLAGDGDHTIAPEMNDAQVAGIHEIEVRDDKGNREHRMLTRVSTTSPEKHNFKNDLLHNLKYRCIVCLSR